MNKYKVGDMVELKKGDRAIIVDFENDEAIIFNLAKMHPGKIKVKDIQKKVCEPNCKVVVEKVNNNQEKEVCNDFEEKSDRTKEEMIDFLKAENKFLKDCILEVLKK